MNPKIASLAFLFFLVNGPANADVEQASNNEIVERAFQAFSRDFKTEWSFTETKNIDDVIFVGRFDPRRPVGEQWSLLSVDARAPTADEREEYEDDKNKEELVRLSTDEDDEKDEDSRMVNLKTVELIEETDEHWLFSFVPNEDDDADDEDAAFMQYVDGQLKVVKDGHYVAFIDLRSKQAFKPATGVKINHFRTRLEFAPAIAGGPIVPQSVDVAVKGRAMLLVKFDETESIRFSDYEYVGPLELAD